MHFPPNPIDRSLKEKKSNVKIKMMNNSKFNRNQESSATRGIGTRVRFIGIVFAYKRTSTSGEFKVPIVNLETYGS